MFKIVKILTWNFFFFPYIYFLFKSKFLLKHLSKKVKPTPAPNSLPVYFQSHPPVESFLVLITTYDIHCFIFKDFLSIVCPFSRQSICIPRRRDNVHKVSLGSWTISYVLENFFSVKGEFEDFFIFDVGFQDSLKMFGKPSHSFTQFTILIFIIFFFNSKAIPLNFSFFFERCTIQKFVMKPTVIQPSSI